LPAAHASDRRQGGFRRRGDQTAMFVLRRHRCWARSRSAVVGGRDSAFAGTPQLDVLPPRHCNLAAFRGFPFVPPPQIAY
jgi:hypothetical protein